MNVLLKEGAAVLVVRKEDKQTLTRGKMNLLNLLNASKNQNKPLFLEHGDTRQHNLQRLTSAASALTTKQTPGQVAAIIFT